jgi:hypothetical protein
MENCVVDWAADLTGSLSSPPRTRVSNFTHRAAVPAYCLAPGKTRRRRQPPGTPGHAVDVPAGSPCSLLYPLDGTVDALTLAGTSENMGLEHPP